MKKLSLILTGILIAAIVVLGIKYYSMTKQEEPSYALAASLYGSDTVALTEDEAYAEGTTENPFVILEIVPYEGYAEIGYMIQGCEPIPMDIAAYDKAGGALIISSTTGMEGDWADEFTYELSEGSNVILDLSNPVDSTNITALTNLNDLGKWRNADHAEYGYYQMVAVGTGEYSQEKRTINGEEAVVFIKAATNGNYNWIPYADSTKPEDTIISYNMWDVEETFDQDVVPTYRIKFYRGKYNFTYNAEHNKFLTDVLNIPYDKVTSYKTVVLTMTPEQLSKKTDLIDKVDLISFAPNSHYDVAGGTNDMVKLWEKYYPSKKKTSPATSFGFNSGNRTCNDLTWEATEEILRKGSVDDHIAPVLFDAQIYNNDTSLSSWYSTNQVTPTKKYSGGTSVTASGTNYINITSKGYFNNISKLYLVMEQMNPAKFYHEYITTGLIKSTNVMINVGGSSQNVKNGSVNMTTAYYTEQQTTTAAPSNCNITSSSYLKFDLSAVAWSIYSFLPYNLFANKAAIDSNAVWETIGIDNYDVINSSLGYVSLRHNIYTYNGDKALTKELTTENKISYNSDTRDAFEYYGLASGTISSAKGVRFLLNLQSDLSYHITSLRILEIEPCKDYIWNGGKTSWDANDTNLSTLTSDKKYQRQFFARFFPHYEGNVTITTMTTAEYIGNVEDINTKYDIILFGLQSGMLAKENGLTVYNDTTLNGKIYLHNGDLITMSNSKLTGLNDDNGTNTYRFSGNDITKLKYEELIDFMKSGNPIILDSGFYDSTNKKTVNTAAIDNNAYLYNLANEANKTTTYVDQLFSVKGFDSNGMSIYNLESKLSTTKCKIVFGNTKGTLQEADCKPVTYKDKTVAGNESLSDAQIYINANNHAFRTLQYKFYIAGDAASTTDYYTAKLYIDINADGKYDEATETTTSIQIMTDKGYVVNYKKLQPGVNYTLSRTLEADYFGVLPWKLEIVSNSNSEVRDSVIDYCALKTNPEEKIILNILQIKANDNTNNSYDNNLDLEDCLTNHKAPFYEPLIKLQDYEIHITSKTVKEFSDLCDAMSSKYGGYTYILSDDDDYNTNGKDLSSNDDGDDFYDYDMIIIGFADCYSDISSNNALHNIQDFIDEGKSVLFTHDTTSYVNLNKSSYESYGYDDYWGYGLNSTFRNTFGMDRFGVMLSNETERSSAGKDYSTLNSLSEKLYSGYIQGYSNMALNRYAASNNWVYDYHHQFVQPTWGNSYYHFEFVESLTNDWPYNSHYTWTNHKNGRSRGPSGYWVNYRMNTDGLYWVDGYWGDAQLLSHPNVNYSDFNTHSVTRTNQGQITVYPYNIPDTFTVATTHAQYYQLDMENKNIVVWYCLSDDDPNVNGRYNTTLDDVRNNYYIYNLGNITYSGVGHSAVTSEMEAKLFVNTMIGAYSATAKEPQIKITNKISSSDASANYVYVDYDIYDTSWASGSDITTLDHAKDSTISALDGTVNAQLVKFRVDDYNILFNKKIYVNFSDNPEGTNTEHLYYMIDTNGTAETSDDVIMTKKLVNGTYMYEIEASQEYAIAVPLTQLNKSNMSNSIGISALITYGKTSTKTKSAMTTFKFIRRGLFDLD